VALESLGYKVYSLDNKHKDKGLQRHVEANFADARRMHTAMKNKWNCNRVFDFIFLDYFFSPVSTCYLVSLNLQSLNISLIQAGYVNTRWTKKFFTETLPFFASNGFLNQGGMIILPYLEHVKDALQESEHEWGPLFAWSFMSDPMDHPLYVATSLAHEQLLLCPDLITNETQLPHLTRVTNTPFIVLYLLQ